MILRGNAPRTLSRAGFWLLLALAMVLLPLAPGGARTEPPRSKAEGEAPKAAVVPGHWDRQIEKHMMAVCTSCHAVTPPRPLRAETPKTWKQAHDDVVKLLAEVKQTQGRLREAEARLERALKVLQRTGPAREGSAAAPENPDAWAEALFDTRYKDFGQVRSGQTIATEFRLTNRTRWPLQIADVRQSSGALAVKVPSRRLNHGETSVIRVTMDTHRLSGSRSAAVYLTLANDLGPDVAKNERTRGAEVKLVVHAIVEKTPGPRTTPTPGMPRALNDKKRLEQMEKLLEEMRREMQELRRELHPKKPITDPFLNLKPSAKPADPLIISGHKGETPRSAEEPKGPGR